MTNNSEQLRKERKGPDRVNLAVIFSLILVLLVIFLPIFRHSERESLQVPLKGVSGFWADSVFLQMNTLDKISMVMMNRLSPAMFKTPDSSFFKSEVFFSPDSLNRFQEYRRSVKGLPAPQLSLIDKPDSIPDNPVSMSADEILSISNDSLIGAYFQHHINRSISAGATLVLYPLWHDPVHSLQFPDTFLAERQMKLVARFNKTAISKGIIPILPMPEKLLKATVPQNYSDSLSDRYLKKIVTSDLKALMLCAAKGIPSDNKDYRHFLKKNYGFYGLIITCQNIRNENDFIRTLTLGSDIIISDLMETKTIKSLIERYNNDKNTRDLVNKAVKRILLYMEWLKNQTNGRKKTDNRSFEAVEHLRLLTALKEASAIRLKDSFNLIPLDNSLPMQRYTVHLPVNIKMEEFLTTIGYFTDYTVLRYKAGGKIKPDKGGINILIVDEGYIPDLKDLSDGLSQNLKLIAIHLGRAETLTKIIKLPAVVHTWSRNPIAQRHLANSLFGGNTLEGIVPRDISTTLRGGSGLAVSQRIRLNHTIPEATGIASAFLWRIDSIVAEAIHNGAFPGCQIFLAVNGNVVYNKALGETTYESGIPVRLNHLYDIASVTKVAATTLAFMKMTEKGKMSVNDPLGKFFKNHTSSLGYNKPDTIIRVDTLVLIGTRRQREKTISAYSYPVVVNDTLLIITDTIIYTSTGERNVFDIKTGQLLTHCSGLPPAMPISGFINTYDRVKGINRFSEIYSPVFIKDSARIKVAEEMYMYRQYFDTLWDKAKSIGISPSTDYNYSDANMIFLQMAIDSVNRESLDEFLQREFYHPLGLRYCLFNPLNKYTADDIIPTANDIRWRRQQIHGTVHDPTAALFGGVAGNAGLFASAHDLGVLGQMLLDSGYYGGMQYLEPSVIRQFTTRQRNLQRGLGFDMPSSGRGIMATSASPQTYGHTGFTGTCMWIDPEYRIVFVFLSNRIYTNTDNQKINFFRVREKVHQVIYDAIEASKANLAH